ncbi:MAG: hypothetical protein F6J98_30205 [Moorea sp. SIO4G2]|uniref:hypothetical protein n=1 Tax=Moorena sp. SIO3F7 TaxID=2607839 RepID=UPI0013F771A2|nr:hypothetical protein [Moorena sp. SIO3F7]NEO12244.1 hypothetical protein [Moorena sp. SIO3E8]NEO64454.1 hypothetical protein [Moorena sp. SIO4G2]
MISTAHPTSTQPNMILSRLPTPDFLKKIGQVWLSPILDRIQFFDMSQEQLSCTYMITTPNRLLHCC